MVTPLLEFGVFVCAGVFLGVQLGYRLHELHVSREIRRSLAEAAQREEQHKPPVPSVFRDGHRLMCGYRIEGNSYAEIAHRCLIFGLREDGDDSL